MSRVGVVGKPNPYQFFGTFAGLPLWKGGLTLLPAAPGVGKTSWAGRMLLEASAAGIPSAHLCYEHTEEELKFRLYKQAEAQLAGPHGKVSDKKLEDRLALSANAVLESLNAQEDTPRAIEDMLINRYGFPSKGPALVIVDYLSCVPVYTYAGAVPPERQAGEATYQLRDVGRRHDWAFVVPAALKSTHFESGDDLDGLFGDERVGYGADRVLLLRREGKQRSCGCTRLVVKTIKDRSGPPRTWHLDFWGSRFYTALEDEFDLHEDAQ